MTSLIIKTSTNTLIKCKYYQHYGDYNNVFYDVDCNHHSREIKVLSRDVLTPLSVLGSRLEKERCFIPHKPVKYILYEVQLQKHYDHITRHISSCNEQHSIS
jgi:hypothetical protein